MTEIMNSKVKMLEEDCMHQIEGMYMCYEVSGHIYAKCTWLTRSPFLPLDYQTNTVISDICYLPINMASKTSLSPTLHWKL